MMHAINMPSFFPPPSVEVKNILPLQHQFLVETTQRKKWPDWGLNLGPSRTAPGALMTELPGLDYTWSAKSLNYHKDHWTFYNNST